MGERVLLASCCVCDSRSKKRPGQEVLGLTVDLFSCAVFGSRL